MVTLSGEHQLFVAFATTVDIAGVNLQSWSLAKSNVVD